MSQSPLKVAEAKLIEKQNLLKELEKEKQNFLKDQLKDTRGAFHHHFMERI